MGTFGRDGKVFAVRLNAAQRAKLDECIKREHVRRGDWRRPTPLGEFMREAALDRAATMIRDLDAQDAADKERDAADKAAKRSTARSRRSTRPVGMPTPAQRVTNAARRASAGKGRR